MTQRACGVKVSRYGFGGSTVSDKTTARQKPELAVELHRRKVTLEITCADHYDAMKLYDELIAECQKGHFTFSMEVNARG